MNTQKSLLFFFFITAINYSLKAFPMEGEARHILDNDIEGRSSLSRAREQRTEEGKVEDIVLLLSNFEEDLSGEIPLEDRLVVESKDANNPYLVPKEATGNHQHDFRENRIAINALRTALQIEYPYVSIIDIDQLLNVDTKKGIYPVLTKQKIQAVSLFVKTAVPTTASLTATSREFISQNEEAIKYLENIAVRDEEIWEHSHDKTDEHWNDFRKAWNHDWNKAQVEAELHQKEAEAKQQQREAAEKRYQEINRDQTVLATLSDWSDKGSQGAALIPTVNSRVFAEPILAGISLLTDRCNQLLNGIGIMAEQFSEQEALKKMEEAKVQLSEIQLKTLQLRIIAEGEEIRLREEEQRETLALATSLFNKTNEKIKDPQQALEVSQKIWSQRMVTSKEKLEKERSLNLPPITRARDTLEQANKAFKNFQEDQEMLSQLILEEKQLKEKLDKSNEQLNILRREPTRASKEENTKLAEATALTRKLETTQSEIKKISEKIELNNQSGYTFIHLQTEALKAATIYLNEEDISLRKIERAQARYDADKKAWKLIWNQEDPNNNTIDADSMDGTDSEGSVSNKEPREALLQQGKENISFQEEEMPDSSLRLNEDTQEHLRKKVEATLVLEATLRSKAAASAYKKALTTDVFTEEDINQVIDEHDNINENTIKTNIEDQLQNELISKRLDNIVLKENSYYDRIQGIIVDNTPLSRASNKDLSLHEITSLKLTEEAEAKVAKEAFYERQKAEQAAWEVINGKSRSVFSSEKNQKEEPLTGSLPFARKSHQSYVREDITIDVAHETLTEAQAAKEELKKKIQAREAAREARKKANS